MSTAGLRQDAAAIFNAGLQAVDPVVAIHESVQRDHDILTVAGQRYSISDFARILVIGAGKAGAPMASAIETILQDDLTAGIVNVKYGHVSELRSVRLIEAGHPVPDESGQHGAREIVQILENASERDLVFCLISGGGSALLPLPAGQITLQEKQTLTSRLLACGAPIHEINAVRKHISEVKGGQLARIAQPATLVTLVLSDVVGDRLDAIASGLTVADPTSFADVERIVMKYDLAGGLPEAIEDHFRKGVRGVIPDTPADGDPIFTNTQNVIIASNFQAIQAAEKKAAQLGYRTLILSSTIEGETRDVAGVHAAIAAEIQKSGHPVSPPVCVLSGGETTVTLRGNGKGGRNQEFVLAAAQDISGLPATVILCAGTDGTDGPTDAAGAICDGETIARAENLGLRAEDHLRNNDAYPYFQALGDLLITGPTHTNVMDLRLILAGND